MSMQKVQECIELVTAEHVPRTVDDLNNLATGSAASAAAELSELASSAQEWMISSGECKALEDAQRDASSQIQRCTQLASACQDEKSNASGSGWTSPAWQECKIFAHLYAAFMMLSGEAATASADSNSPENLAGKAVEQADMALMSGCPYEMAEPILTYASHQLSQQQEHVCGSPTSGAKIRVPSTVVEEMCITCDDAPILRVDVGDIVNFRKEFWKLDRPVVISGLMTDWPALEKWSHIQWWKLIHGTRTVPLEIGCYGQQKWREALCTMSDFVDAYMTPSVARDMADEAKHGQGGSQGRSYAARAAETSGCNSSICNDTAADSSQVTESGREGDLAVAYMAQHRIFDQIPELLEDVPAPTLWTKGYEVMNMWMGTQGTVTPLHWDSMDNFLCQIAGAKYVRLYARDQTPYLYVDKSHAGAGKFHRQSQGNISNVNVEAPDLTAHPAFATAAFTHTVLQPGDVLFMPARCWHYVRSLSTSISVNFWF